MKQEAMSYFTDTHLTVLGLVIFVTVFIGVVLWVNRKGSTSHYKHMSELPLKENGNV